MRLGSTHPKKISSQAIQTPVFLEIEGMDRTGSCLGCRDVEVVGVRRCWVRAVLIDGWMDGWVLGNKGEREREAGWVRVKREEEEEERGCWGGEEAVG